MSTPEHGSDFVRICSVVNEVEAALVVQMLQQEGIVARSDASPGSTIFGGLPFETGHHLSVPKSQAEKAREILSKHPHFQDIKEETTEP